MSGSFDFSSGVAKADADWAKQTCTVVAWVKPTAPITDDAIIAQGWEAATPYGTTLKGISGDLTRAEVRIASNTTGSSSTSTLPIDTWTHVAGRFNADGTVAARYTQIFFNGVSEAQVFDSKRSIGCDEFLIGQDFAGGDSFPGLITQVGFWGTELSDAEIASIASGADPLTIQDASLEAYYDGTSFDDDGTLKLQDMSGNDHHLTITGATASTDEPGAAQTPEIRKSSTFDIETELSGTVTDATLDGNAIAVDSQDGTTVTLTDSDGSITTSGEYDLVLTDDSADPDETITVQVDVYGVVPSDNPWQKDGSALADLTDVQYRVVAGSDLNGTELFYTGTGATDASGNIPTFDVSDTAAEVDDTVHIVALSDAGESIVATETVELI